MRRHWNFQFAADDDWHKVFLSSTSDLADERKEVVDQAPSSFRIYRYERDMAAGSEAPEARLEKVLSNGTEVFVGLYGERYGSLYPEAGKVRSIVEWEYDLAVQLGIEIHGHVKRPLDASLLEDNQERFLQRIGHLRNGSWITPFSDRVELTRNFNTRLLLWLSEVQQREIKALRMASERPHARLWSKAFWILCVLGSGVAAAIGFVNGEWSVLAVVALFAGLVSAGAALRLDAMEELR